MTMKCIHVFIITSVLLLAGCKKESLLTGLDQVQANEVMALLQKNNIKAEKHDVAKVGYSISVPRDDFPTAVDLMEVYNLPSKPRIEVAEMFPADALISSPRAEVARIYSAIEQRLEQTLNQISGVVTSRVHVSYDMNNTDAQKGNHPVNISALLKVKGDISSNTSLIADSKRLLRNSFNNLEYDNISVVLTTAPAIQQYSPVVPSGKSTAITSYVFFVLALVIISILIAVFFIYNKMSRSKKVETA